MELKFDLTATDSLKLSAFLPSSVKTFGALGSAVGVEAATEELVDDVLPDVELAVVDVVLLVGVVIDGVVDKEADIDPLTAPEDWLLAELVAAATITVELVADPVLAAASDDDGEEYADPEVLAVVELADPKVLVAAVEDEEVELADSKVLVAAEEDNEEVVETVATPVAA